MNADDYVHRIGRTGRAGQKGRAWMLVTSSDAKFMDAIEKKIGRSIDERTLSGEKVKDGSKSSDTSRPNKKPKINQQPSVDRGSKPNNIPDKKHHNLKNNGDVRQSKGEDDKNPVGFGDDIPNFF
jgi:superfamily II DNA/RNA helicase